MATSRLWEMAPCHGEHQMKPHVHFRTQSKWRQAIATTLRHRMLTSQPNRSPLRVHFSSQANATTFQLWKRRQAIAHIQWN
eukprot:4717198-Pyramimonas_sp.AAC.1